ncbi:MAG TPA: hypothetical protein PKD86_06260, partial [Gemmatales bacterium]|nr:hypothetical protein [Gemmatales bacterium]
MVSDGVDPKLAADLGPQPEQVKLLAYLALVSGCRGLAFWDEPLAIPGQATPTSSGSGTPPPLTAAYIAPRQTLAQALLNHELALLEPLLASRHGSELVGTRHPEIKMALMRFDGGLLVIPLWLGSGAQHVAGQMTLPQLDLVVPGTPRDAQAWLVSPVDVRTLAHERVPGGVRVAIPEFALTAAVIFTADINHVARLQQWVLQHQRQAAQRSYELAWDQIRQVEAVQQQLAEQGHAHPATLSLLGEARRHLAEAYIAWNRGNVSDFRTAYEEAQRAQRPLRLLMRSQWEQAITSVDAPTASPFTVSYVSLPRHYRFIHEVKACQVVPNVLAAGDFEADPNETLAGWTVQSTTLDAVVPHLARVAVQPRQGRQCLKLEVRPKDSANAPAA